MAISFFGRGNRKASEDPLDSIFSDSLIFPSFPLSSAWTVSSFPDHPGFARDVAAVANTQVDWKETPDSHIFKANLPGKFIQHLPEFSLNHLFGLSTSLTIPAEYISRPNMVW